MALIDCPECNHKVSSFASCCPGCGCPIKDNQKPSLVSKAEIVDFNMGFGNMVSLMVRASIAVIPAAIILMMICFVIYVTLGIGRIVSPI